MHQLAILTHDLSRAFNSLQAVDKLDLEVPQGLIFGFLGPNGAGKTTTIRLLLGLLEPTGGQAQVLGFDNRTQADKIRERSGALLEHSGLYERLTAEDNLEFYGRIWQMEAHDRQERIRQMLTQLGLWDRRGETVGKWSRGMKQKLAIARTLLHRPALVFLDEPTAGLDPVAAAAVRDDLAGLAAREGVTVFLTTHNLTEAEKLCQKVAVIRQGRLVAAGSPDELRSRSGSQRLEISGSGFTPQVLASLRARSQVSQVELQDGRLLIDLLEGNESAPLVSLLVGAGAPVEEVRRVSASLEEIFLTLMEEEK
jgi:ABC-2 type transport system ATP-binding protein